MLLAEWFWIKSLARIKFPRDLLILMPSTLMWPLCIQKLARWLLFRAILWAISFSWWGNFKSTPPPWISIFSPNKAFIMTTHSVCQPGIPIPHGDLNCSPSVVLRHKAKSRGSSFFSSISTRDPDSKSSRVLLDKIP